MRGFQRFLLVHTEGQPLLQQRLHTMLQAECLSAPQERRMNSACCT